MAARTLLITGATGKQGGALVNALLKANADFEIIALTRNAESASAQALVKKSPKIKLITGDFSSIDNVFRKAKEVSKAPIWGVFSVQTVNKNEETEGKSIVDAALKNGVSHFIYTSVQRGVNSDTDPTNVPHFISKYNIEQHLKTKTKDTATTWTILRPVAFWDNLMPNFFGKVFTASWLMRLGKQDKKLQLIATSDIGVFAARAFIEAGADEYRNKSIPLASDELTYNEMKSIFEKTTGETLPTTYMFLAGFLHRLSADFMLMFKWFHDVGFGVDMQAARRRNPEMKDFKTWLETESGWKKKA